MKKIKSRAFGKDCYLLGEDKHGIWYWLEESTFDCDWYWSIGYVETYTNNKQPGRSSDINGHQHFEGLFLRGARNGYDAFREFFVDTPLSDTEIWKLMELMNTLYGIRKYSDILNIGGSNYTNNTCSNIIKNEVEYERINKIVIPELLKELYTLLGGELK